VRGRGVFPFISQGASLTSSSLFDIYIYIYIYIYIERERERERERVILLS
jgi:cell division protein FtsW (lipid II flippase)